MTPQLRALAEKMAEDAYPSNGWGGIRSAYLAGFEARDGMESEELELYKDFYNKFGDSISKYFFELPKVTEKQAKLNCLAETIEAVKLSQEANVKISAFNKAKNTNSI